MGTIVIGYSPDEFGRAAVERGLIEARLRSSSLLIVNGTRGDAYVDEHFATGDQLGRLTGWLEEESVSFEVRQTMGNDVAEQVLEVADSVDAELVVLGIRRRTPVGKLLMGSVAQKVILGARCAVLTVKPPV